MIQKLSLFLFLMMMCSTLFALDGEGTPESPYLISTVNDLYAVNNDLAAHYKMVNDIDFGDIVHTKSVIGKTVHTDLVSEVFTGAFDGGGYCIKNFAINFGKLDSDSVNLSLTTYVGLFSVTKGATIKNLSFDANETGQITIGYSVEEECYAGVLAGLVVGGKVENCHSNTSIVSSGKITYIGGLMGGARTLVESCSSSSHISILGAERSCIGGICGDYNSNGNSLYGVAPYSSPELKNIVFTGLINSIAGGRLEVGGITGSAYNVSFSNCRFEGNIYSLGGVSRLGGVSGDAYDSNFVGCSSEGNIEVDSDVLYCGGVLGDGTYTSISSSRTNVNINSQRFGDIGGIAGYIIGDVRDCHSHVEITARGGGSKERASIGGLIGAEGEARACSSYGNIVIKSSDDQGGFVGGLIGGYGSVESCMSSCNIKVESLSSMTVGGLVGYVHLFTHVHNSYATGVVDTRDSIGSVTGGLIGEALGEVSLCYSTGDVYSSGICGGLAGEALHLNDCFSTSDLYVTYQPSENSSRNKCVGGLVGLQEGKAKNCYAGGEIYVDANSGEPVYVGGFVGKELIYASNSSNFEAINCYSKANITLSGDDLFYFGGFLSGAYAEYFVSGGTITNCYSDVTINYDNANENSVIGGFIGERLGTANFSRCFYNLEMTGNKQSVSFGDNHGIKGLSDSEFTDIIMFIDAGWIFGCNSRAPWVHNPYGPPRLYFQKFIPNSALSGEEGSLEELKAILDELGIINALEENLALYQEILSNSSVTFQHDTSIIQQIIDLANEGVTSCAITISPGWNMVSCPFLNWSPAEHNIDCQLFKFCNGRYENVSADMDLVPGCGYWLFYPENLPKNIVMSGERSEHATINITTGWNLFGPIHNVGTKAEKDVSEYSWLFNEPFYWQGDNYSSISEAESSNLKLGTGYWGFVKESELYVKRYRMDKVSFRDNSEFTIDCLLEDYNGLKIYIWDKTTNEELLGWSYFPYNSLKKQVVGRLKKTVSIGHEYSIQIIPVNGELGGKLKSYNFSFTHQYFVVTLDGLTNNSMQLNSIEVELVNNSFRVTKIYSVYNMDLEWSAVLYSQEGQIIETATGINDINDSNVSISDVFDSPLINCTIVLSVRVKNGNKLGKWKTFRFEK